MPERQFTPAEVALVSHILEAIAEGKAVHLLPAQRDLLQAFAARLKADRTDPSEPQA